MKFCIGCGHPLPVGCPQCGYLSPAQARFCGNCGGALGSPAASTSERRQLTVLFSDLVGSTRLSEQMDPEDFRELIQTYQGACSKAVAELDGHVAQLLGDGVLAYFGWPSAHEDDARRAAEAALRIVDSISRMESLGRPLQVRIGIHTGVVVVGGLGADGQQEKLALGETPNLAARIQSEAPPNEILASEATLQLIDGYFDVRPFKTCLLKGLSRETTLYRVVARSAAPSRMEASSPILRTPLSGRREEYQTLAECWRRVASGRRHTVHISGEAGLGKSRLVAELTAEAQRSTAVLRTCHCSPYHANTAFYPFIELLSSVMGFAPGEPAEEKRGKLKTFLEHFNQSTPNTYFLLASLLEIGERGAPSEEMTSQRQRRLTLEILRLLFHDLAPLDIMRARQLPILFVMEDLHWADPSTLAVLQTAVADQEQAPILLLLSYRPEFQPAWKQHENETVMHLKPLGQKESETLAQRVAHGRSLPPAILDQICSRTGGVPLFLEEVTKAVLESGALREVNNHYELAGELPDRLIPATVRDSLTARLDRLGGSREILRVASVLGQEFSYRMLRAAASCEDSALGRALAEAEDAQLIYRTIPPPDVHYAFKHALIRDAAYESLLRKSRQQYHRRIAQVVVDQFPEIAETQPGVLGVHCEGAEQLLEAAGYRLKAGRREMERAACMEAVGHLDAGLRDLASLPDSPERQSMELAIQLSLMATHMALTGWQTQEVEKTGKKARDIAIHLSDHRSLFAALWGLSSTYLIRGELDPTLALGQDLLEMALKSGSPMLELQARYVLSVCFHRRGEFRRSLQDAERVLALSTPEMERMLVGTFQISTAASVGFYTAECLWMMGEPDEGWKRFLSAQQMSREMRNPTCTAIALGYSLTCGYFWDKPEIIPGPAAELQLLCEQEGFRFWSPQINLLHGWAKVRQGDQQGGIEQIRLAIREIDDTMRNDIYFPARVLFTGVLHSAGRLDEAYLLVDDAIAKAGKMSYGFMLPDAFRLRGEIHRDCGNRVAALQDFEEAVRIAQNQSARTYELRALASKNRLLQSSAS